MTDSTVASGSPARFPMPTRAVHQPRWWASAALLTSGIFLILDVALREHRWMEIEPWSRAVVFRSSQAPLGGTPVWMRSAPVDGADPQPEIPSGDQARLNRYEEEKGDFTGWIAAVDAAASTFEPLLASGRLPRPGQPELLAGPLAANQTMVLDGLTFTVVGRLRPTVACFTISYLLPADHALASHFQNHPAVTSGYLFPKGPPEHRNYDPDQVLLWSPAQTLPVYSAEMWLGLLLAVWGGAQLYRRVLLSARRGAPRLFQPLLAEIARRRHEWRAAHLMLYGLFFGAMAAACFHPKLAYMVRAYVTHAFSQGSLGYIGAAYESQNIPRAALATFVNNYVVQTLVLTFGASLVVVPLGALKTAMTFMMVGFGMAPLWTLQAGLLWYHALTLVLEMEAYVLAVFVVVRWCTFQIRALLAAPRAFLRAAIGRAEPEGTVRFIRRRLCWNARVMLGGVLVTALMLALAALYEAATLIAIG